MSYNVVFCQTGKKGTTAGIRTWTQFRDKEHFDQWYDDVMKETHAVVAEGVTQNQAGELCEQVPLKCRVNAALNASCQGTDEINPEVLGIELATTLHCFRDGLLSRGNGVELGVSILHDPEQTPKDSQINIPVQQLLLAKDLRGYIISCAKGVVGTEEEQQRMREMIKNAGVDVNDLVRAPMEIIQDAVGIFTENILPDWPVLEATQVFFYFGQAMNPAELSQSTL